MKVGTVPRDTIFQDTHPFDDRHVGAYNSYCGHRATASDERSPQWGPANLVRGESQQP